MLSKVTGINEWFILQYEGQDYVDAQVLEDLEIVPCLIIHWKHTLMCIQETQ